MINSLKEKFVNSLMPGAYEAPKDDDTSSSTTTTTTATTDTTAPVTTETVKETPAHLEYKAPTEITNDNRLIQRELWEQTVGDFDKAIPESMIAEDKPAWIAVAKELAAAPAVLFQQPTESIATLDTKEVLAKQEIVDLATGFEKRIQDLPAPSSGWWPWS